MCNFHIYITIHMKACSNNSHWYVDILMMLGLKKLGKLTPSLCRRGGMLVRLGQVSSWLGVGGGDDAEVGQVR